MVITGSLLAVLGERLLFMAANSWVVIWIPLWRISWHQFTDLGHPWRKCRSSCGVHLTCSAIGQHGCVAFAIRNSVCCASVTRKEVEFDQSEMRFKGAKVFSFPNKAKVSNWSRHFPYREIELYCTCLMPETYQYRMTECEGCELWFHTDCVGVLCVPEHWYYNSSTSQWLKCSHYYAFHEYLKLESCAWECFISIDE